jgi:hypothetical protein
MRLGYGLVHQIYSVGRVKGEIPYFCHRGRLCESILWLSRCHIVLSLSLPSARRIYTDITEKTMDLLSTKNEQRGLTECTVKEALHVMKKAGASIVTSEMLIDGHERLNVTSHDSMP